VKALLNRGQHPTFIGRKQVAQSAGNGGVVMFVYRAKDVAVAVVNARLNVLTVLCVVPEHRRHGLGSACLEYLQCNFARVIEATVPFFERNGYTSIGEMKQGRSLKTQIMVRKDLLTLAGRVAKLYG
jgi:GNAT superfamily N-acetyltransferase